MQEPSGCISEVLRTTIGRDIEDRREEMLEEILQEIDKMGYPSEEIGRDLEDARVTDRYTAAAYGFQEAKDRIVEIIRSHSNDGWTYCRDRKNLPKEEGFYLVTLEHENVMDDMKVVKAFFIRNIKILLDMETSWHGGLFRLHTAYRKPWVMTIRIGSWTGF